MHIGMVKFHSWNTMELVNVGIETTGTHVNSTLKNFRKQFTNQFFLHSTNGIA